MALTESFARNAPDAQFARTFFTRVKRLCIDLTLKSFAPDALFASGVNVALNRTAACVLF